MKRTVFFFATLLVISIQQIAAQNVGIGTTTPTQKLDVNGNVNVSGTLLANGTAGTAGRINEYGLGHGVGYHRNYNGL